MHTLFALLCFVVVIHWLIFPYPSGLLHWHYGNLTIAPVPAKQLWWIWINTSCEFIMNDCITTTKQSTTKPCAYFLGYTVLKQRGTDKCANQKQFRCACKSSVSRVAYTHCKNGIPNILPVCRLFIVLYWSCVRSLYVFNFLKYSVQPGRYNHLNWIE